MAYLPIFENVQDLHDEFHFAPLNITEIYIHDDGPYMRLLVDWPPNTFNLFVPSRPINAAEAFPHAGEQ